METKLLEKSLSFPLMVLVTVLSSNTVCAQEVDTGFLKPPNASNVEKPPRPTEFVPSVTVQKSDRFRSKQAKEQIKEIANQINTYGYRVVDEKDISYFSHESVKHGFVPMEAITLNTSSPLSTISEQSGIFKTMSFLGAVAEQPDKNTKKWTSVRRYYSLSNGELLMLSEVDYKAARISTAFPEELVNENVNGFPAMLVTLKTPTGNALTRLTWGSNKKLYTLERSGHVSGLGIRNELVALAMGIKEQE